MVLGGGGEEEVEVEQWLNLIFRNYCTYFSSSALAVYNSQIQHKTEIS
jgi:hypothetical protein